MAELCGGGGAGAEGASMAELCGGGGAGAEGARILLAGTGAVRLATGGVVTEGGVVFPSNWT